MINLNHKITGNNYNNDNTDVNYNVPEGRYTVKLVAVYPWKELKKETTAFARDEAGKLLKDTNGNKYRVKLGMTTWYSTDAMFEIVKGDLTGSRVRMSLSTHPDMIGGINNFLYSVGIFDVALADLKDHLGGIAVANVKVKTDTYTDKDTGLDVTKEKSYVSYLEKATDADLPTAEADNSIGDDALGF